MLQTCHGSLHTGLEVQSGETLLIRGGTSSIGLATLALAKQAGLKVISTSRSQAKVDVLKAAGADEVVMDAGSVAVQVRASHPQGVDRVLELILGGQWELPSFRPMGDIPTAVRLTSYAGEAGDISRAQLQHYVSMVESGKLDMSSSGTSNPIPTDTTCSPAPASACVMPCDVGPTGSAAAGSSSQSHWTKYPLGAW